MKPAELLNLFRSRRSAFEYGKGSVSASQLNQILEAGRWAPSSYNLQPWHFVVIKDPKMISKLSAECYYGFFRMDPPLMIAIVLDPYVKEEMHSNKEEYHDYLHTHRYMNISQPALQMCLQAEALNLSSAILSPHVSKANQILGVPKSHQTMLIVGIGQKARAKKHDQQIKQPLAERKKLSEIVKYETFSKKKK